MYPMERASLNHISRRSAVKPVERKKVLVFSPDADLAKSLALLLENQFSIECETRLENLLDRIGTSEPAVLLIDLYAFPSDILRETNVLRARELSIPVVVLRVYRQLNPEIEEAIRDVADLILYKPLDVSMVADAIHALLDVH